jgi:hypothetical protein
MRKALFIDGNYSCLITDPEFRPHPDLHATFVHSISEAMYQSADIFVIPIESLFRTRNLSATYHQVQRLMDEHPGARLILTGFKLRNWVQHLVVDLENVTGVRARYVNIGHLITVKALASEVFADWAYV